MKPIFYVHNPVFGSRFLAKSHAAYYYSSADAMPLLVRRGPCPCTDAMRAVARMMQRGRHAAVAAQWKGAANSSWRKAVSSAVWLARGDEKEVLGTGGFLDGVRRQGRRSDKDISSEAVVMAAFAPSDAAAERSTGLGEKTALRAQVLCAEALATLQEQRFREVMEGLRGGFAVVKRSCDETPFHMRRGSWGPATVSKLLNQRCFLRWSTDRACRAIFPAVELEDESHEGLMEALERVSPALNLDGVRAAADRADVFLQVHIMDSLPANGKLFQRWAATVPQALHWKLRCDAHPFCIDHGAAIGRPRAVRHHVLLAEADGAAERPRTAAAAHGANGGGGGARRRRQGRGASPCRGHRM